jgi:nitrate reductase gamma subunit
MGMLLVIIAYLVYAAFWMRLSLHTFLWLKSARRLLPHHPAPDVKRLPAFATAAVDMFFFRRLFASNKVLWLGSWAFHMAFLFVVLRHLKYFLDPVPDCIWCVQPFGIAAGYILAFSLLYVMMTRTVARVKYVSYQNYVILGLLFFISATGLLMRNFFRPDLIDVKSFVMGIVAFRPSPLPGNFFFVVHFSLVLLLIPYLPFHIFTAPLIVIEASKRQQGLDMVMHGK